MRPCRMALAVGVALALAVSPGCGANTQATRPPALAPAAGQRPDATLPAAARTPAEPSPADTVPTPQVTAGAESPPPEPATPTRPVVTIETPPPRGRTLALPATYTWQAGDNLFLVARRFYGDGRLWPKIVEANQAIQGLSEIPAGTVLAIPPR